MMGASSSALHVKNSNAPKRRKIVWNKFGPQKFHNCDFHCFENGKQDKENTWFAIKCTSTGDRNESRIQDDPIPWSFWDFRASP